jgi:electron transfer flavoprotein-quinone oxidoreductase
MLRAWRDDGPMSEKFDVIVVGAGPAGNAAAYTLARAGVSVLQIERGETPGTKNVQGAILYSHALEEIVPDFRKHAPLERHIIEQRMWLMDEGQACTGVSYRDDGFTQMPHNRYTIVRARFDRWFSDLVREAGAMVINETTVTGLLRDAAGKVVGVQTERAGGEVLADAVILADGVNSLVGQRAGLRDDIKAEHSALAVKETLGRAWSSRSPGASPTAWSAPDSSTPTGTRWRSASAACSATCASSRSRRISCSRA